MYQQLVLERKVKDLINTYLQLGALDPLALGFLPLQHTVSGPSAFSACNLLSIAVLSVVRLSGEAAKTHERGTPAPISSRFLCPRPPFSYLARPTKTAMPRRLSA